MRYRRALISAGALVFFLVETPVSVINVRNMYQQKRYASSDYVTEDQLNVDLKKEQERLGLNGVTIDAKLSGDVIKIFDIPLFSSGNWSKKTGDRKYEVRVSNLSFLAHELWHVKEIRDSRIRPPYFTRTPTYWAAEWRAQNYVAERFR